MTAAVTIPASLLPPVMVAAALACPAARIVEMVEAGELAFAFDIQRQGSNRACLRIFSGSVAIHRREAPTHAWPDVASVVNAILPGNDNPSVETLARAFACKRQHLQNLLATPFTPGQGCLRYRRQGRKGPGGTGYVCRASVVDFLRGRQTP